jgi:hypothetical protein
LKRIPTITSQKKERHGTRRGDHQHPKKRRKLAITIEREEGEALNLEQGHVIIVERKVSNLNKRLTTVVKEERIIEN